MPKKLSELRWYKIVEILYNNLESTFNINEIARKADISSSTSFELLKLAKKDEVVIRKESTKQHDYRINFSNRLARKTCELVELQKVIRFFKNNRNYDIIFRDIKNELVQSLKDDLLVLIIFGSIPRGYSTKKSDIDILLIVPKKPRSYLKWEKNVDKVVEKIHAWHGREVSPIFISIDEFREKLREKHPFIIGLVKDHFILHGSEIEQG